MKEQVNLEQYIEKHGYTKEEWNACVEQLCAKGVGRGCYQDYNLLMLVLGWLGNFKSVI